MKKTLIALLALSGVACGATVYTGDFAGDFAWSSTTTPTFTFEDTDTSPLAITLSTTESFKSTTYQAGTFTPDSNVGDGDDWTLNFTITNKTDVDLVLGAISLDIFSYSGGGVAQSSQAPRAIIISLTGDVEGNTSKVITPGGEGYSNSLSTQDLTFNTPVTIGANGSITFSMNVHKDTTANEEHQKGTFVGLQGATFKLVPEPATASLSLLGLAALMIRRRR